MAFVTEQRQARIGKAERWLGWARDGPRPRVQRSAKRGDTGVRLHTKAKPGGLPLESSNVDCSGVDMVCRRHANEISSEDLVLPLHGVAKLPFEMFELPTYRLICLRYRLLCALAEPPEGVNSLPC